jgi:hypothetical protein
LAALPFGARVFEWLNPPMISKRFESEIPNVNRVPAKVAPEVLDDYVGEYELSPGKVVKITREGDSLMEQEPDDP